MKRMVSNKKAIPSAFNMSFGLIPAIVCMILSKFMLDEYALVSCTLIGLIYSFGLFYLSRKKIYNFILYITTGTLLLLSLLNLLPIDLFPRGTIPFTIELVIIMFTAVLFYGQSALKKLFNKKRCPQCDDLISKSLDSSIVSARIIFITGVLHFITASIFVLIDQPPSLSTNLILYQLLPPILLLANIGINQVGIYFANRIIDTDEEIPIVNEQDNIVGKRFKVEASAYKDAFMNPVIRIALIHDGMLYLCNRKSTSIVDPNKTDIPLEAYLQFRESLDEGVQRLVLEAYPQAGSINPRFSIKHHFKNEKTNRLIYLYIAYITDDELLCNPYFQGGKLWTFQQIEQNLGKEYFSDFFESEYQHLETVTSIWEEFGK